MSSSRRAPSPAPQPALLVRQFDAFYSWLQSLAGRLRRGTSNADAARHAIVELFEKQENALRPLGAGFLNDIAAPARRVMALMVDQVLGGELDWPGRDDWASHPLAPQLTGAGSPADVAKQVRQDVEHLVQVKGASKAQQALARVDLQALGLGFRGPFEASEIDELKAKLFALLYPRAGPQATSTQATPQILFPEAYAHTVSHGDRSLLPTARPWWRILAVAGLLLLLISWPVWRDATELLRAALATVPVENTVPSAGGSPGSSPPGSGSPGSPP